MTALCCDVVSFAFRIFLNAHWCKLVDKKVSTCILILIFIYENGINICLSRPFNVKTFNSEYSSQNKNFRYVVRKKK